MRRITIVNVSHFQYETPEERLTRMADEKLLTVKLRDLGVTLPVVFGRIDLVALVELGKLKEARERFPSKTIRTTRTNCRSSLRESHTTPRYRQRVH